LNKVSKDLEIQSDSNSSLNALKQEQKPLKPESSIASSFEQREEKQK